jgi:hypothetical protein
MNMIRFRCAWKSGGSSWIDGRSGCPCSAPFWLSRRDSNPQSPGYLSAARPLCYGTGETIRDAGRSRTCFGSGCSRPPGRPAPASSRNKSRRWDSNPLGPLYEGCARPVEYHRPDAAASAGVEPARPRFKASVPSRGPGQKQVVQESKPQPDFVDSALVTREGLEPPRPVGTAF